jgi:hypothetical protein
MRSLRKNHTTKNLRIQPGEPKTLASQSYMRVSIKPGWPEWEIRL